jgi:MFS family permease
MSVTATLTPLLLLSLVFANGIVFTVRWPVFSASIPGVVPRRELPVAMALNGVANNGSRIAGPLLAGAIIAATGSRYVFALNAALSVLAVVLLTRLPREVKAATLPSERFRGHPRRDPACASRPGSR